MEHREITRHMSNLIAIASNGSIYRNLEDIIYDIANHSDGLRMVVDLEREFIVYKNPLWIDSEPWDYYHYQTWMLGGKEVGISLTSAETEVLDEILTWDFINSEDEDLEEVEL